MKKENQKLTNSFPMIYWQYAKQSIRKPFLFIDRSINRYSLTQDKTPKYLSGKGKS